MAKRILFEMGAKWDEGWESDNRDKNPKSRDETTLPPQQHRLRIVTEKRRGKTVTVVSGFHMTSSQLTKLLKELKRALATGGTQKEGKLEFQGDVIARLRTLLKQHEFVCI